jgi:hypothetical protein
MPNDNQSEISALWECRMNAANTENTQKTNSSTRVEGQLLEVLYKAGIYSHYTYFQAL